MTADWNDRDFAPAYPDGDVEVTPLGGNGAVAILAEFHGDQHYPILRIRLDGAATLDIPLSAKSAAELGAEMMLVAGRCHGRAGIASVDAMEGDLRHSARVTAG